MSRDEEHLKLLSIFHKVAALVVAVFGSFPMIHLIIGIAMLAGMGGKDGPPALVGLMFVAVAAPMIAAGWTMAVCLFLAGGMLAERRRYTFCLVVAALSCMFMPVGTVLGVFTILVLMRPSVKALFGVQQESGPSAAS